MTKEINIPIPNVWTIRELADFSERLIALDDSLEIYIRNQLGVPERPSGHTTIQTKAALENLHEDTLLMDSNGKIWSVDRYHRVTEEHKAQLVYSLPAVIVATSDQIQESRTKLGIEK